MLGLQFVAKPLQIATWPPTRFNS